MDLHNLSVDFKLNLILTNAIGMTWREMKELWRQGFKEYFSEVFNWVDVLQLTLYWIAIILTFVSYYSVSKVQFTNPLHSYRLQVTSFISGVLLPQYSGISNTLGYNHSLWCAGMPDTPGTTPISFYSVTSILLSTTIHCVLWYARYSRYYSYSFSFWHQKYSFEYYHSL